MEQRVGKLESGFAVHEERIKSLEQGRADMQEIMREFTVQATSDREVMLRYISQQEGREAENKARDHRQAKWMKFIGVMIAFITLLVAIVGLLIGLSHSEKITTTVQHSLLHLKSSYSAPVEADNHKASSSLTTNEEAVLGEP